MKREIAQTDTNFSDLQGKLTGQVYIAISVKLTQVRWKHYDLKSVTVATARANPSESAQSLWCRMWLRFTETEEDRAIWKSCLSIFFFFLLPRTTFGV